MGISKSEKFSIQQNEMADIAKALAHPARIAILEVLIQKNSCFCGDIVEVLPLSQSTVSQHLKELKKANLIKGTIEGPSVCYCINADMLTKAKSILNNFFDSAQKLASCC